MQLGFDNKVDFVELDADVARGELPLDRSAVLVKWVSRPRSERHKVPLRLHRRFNVHGLALFLGQFTL